MLNIKRLKQFIALWIVLGGLVFSYSMVLAAITPPRATDDGGTSGRGHNRSIVADPNDPDVFYTWGGGTVSANCPANCIDSTTTYNIRSDAWSGGLDDIPIQGYSTQQLYGSFDNWLVGGYQAATCCQWAIYNITGDTWTAFAGPGINFGLICGSLGGQCVGTVANNGRFYVFTSISSTAAPTASSCDGSSTPDAWIAHVAALDIALNLLNPPYVCGFYSDMDSWDMTGSRIAHDDDAIYFTASDSGTQRLRRYDIINGTLTTLENLPNVPALAFSTSNGAYFGFPAGTGDFTSIDIYQVVEDQLTYAETYASADFTYINAPVTNCANVYGFSSAASINPDGTTNVVFGSALGCVTNSTPPTINRWWASIDLPLGIDFTIPNSIDTWIPNFLDSLGMNSPFGKLFVSTILIISFMVLMIVKGVHVLITLGLGGMVTVFLTAATIFDPALLLAMVGVMGLGIMLLITSLILGGDKDG